MYDTGRLEYPKVVNIIKEYCGSEPSKKKLLEIKPLDNISWLADEFELLRELINAIASGYKPVLKEIHETTDMLGRARVKGSALLPDEIVKIRENIINASILKRQYESLKEKFPLISRKVGEIRIPLMLLKRIEGVLDEHGVIRDDASPRLEEITSRQKLLRQHIEAELNRYLHSPETRHYIQERHITLKDDRYVIPVKQSFRGNIPGVVHAHSGSEKTLFIEPLSVIEENNELRLLEKEKEKEVRRILVELTGVVRDKSEDLSQLQDVLINIDVLMAKWRFMEEYDGTIPEFSKTKEIFIEGGRHPLLVDGAVPVDFYLKEPGCGVVITGPNTGGKTVTLKMIGLFVLLAQSGFPVPAKMMRTAVFKSVFADIGDESSIEQSLSTFSAHIRNIINITKEADKKSLVLIDELGAGTDPIEGGALGAAILNYLLEREVFTVVTTHFSFIKMYALGSDKTEVASVEFDPETCRPTYRLVMGIPGRSNAVEVARHLGLDTEILHKTREYLSEEDRAIDRIFKNLALIEKRLKLSQEEVGRKSDNLERMVAEYTERLRDVEERERILRSEYGIRLSEMLEDLRKKLERTIKEVRESQGSKEAIKKARSEIAGVEKEFKGALSLVGPKRMEKGTQQDLPKVFIDQGDFRGREGVGHSIKELYTGDVKPGDYVTIVHDSAGKLEGKVVEVSDDRITILSGSLHITVNKEQISKALIHRKKPVGLAHVTDGASKSSTWSFTPARQRDALSECDIRGMRYDDAMSEVNRFIDNAVLGNVKHVSIIHGLGTGALREGVQEILKNRRDVEHFEYARPEQGGYGCTIVTLKG
ncbi:MAG: endonuclease MutS2 [Spirochaetota bacterium]